VTSASSAIEAPVSAGKVIEPVEVTLLNSKHGDTSYLNQKIING